jgi:aspartate carbamoyltransferase regulatory subunit
MEADKSQGAGDDKRDQKMKIKLIKNGVVIDHIAAGRSLEVLRILNIVGVDYEDEVTIGMNIPSKSMGKKDIMKLENRDIKTDEINKIAIIAPRATINRIRDYKVVKKEKVVLPNEIIGIVKCPNPQCISNKAREPVQPFLVVVQRDPLTLSCKYCEREVKNL